MRKILLLALLSVTPLFLLGQVLVARITNSDSAVTKGFINFVNKKNGLMVDIRSGYDTPKSHTFAVGTNVSVWSDTLVRMHVMALVGYRETGQLSYGTSFVFKLEERKKVSAFIYASGMKSFSLENYVAHVMFDGEFYRRINDKWEAGIRFRAEQEKHREPVFGRRGSKSYDHMYVFGLLTYKPPNWQKLKIFISGGLDYRSVVGTDGLYHYDFGGSNKLAWSGGLQLDLKNFKK